ncbi:MAG: glycerol kinase GlpK [Planctomycetaceae bacterium]|nr:glycerol kinase GlpK [Planctomycetaceae bacterium]MCB9950480.1 glycerol kinase GlpK [Planctomycetaceae bacterium]
MRYVLSLDQGTTSSRSMVFNEQAVPVCQAQQEFPQIYPSPGHVEHNPEEIWKSQYETAKAAIAECDSPESIAAIGIANQRETVVLWDRKTGNSVANAIVWQSRITAPQCRELKKQGVEPTVKEKTGLLLDPYFSATKIAHLLDSITGLRERAELGEILFGTIDSFLIWRLTGGRVHATDVTNASRTLLFNIHTLQWDDELLRIFSIPKAMLPEVRPTNGDFGETAAELFGRSIPIRAAAGDQQAATFGQGCFTPGTAKNTYGTGCFMVWNTGETPVPSQHGLLTTIGWQVDGNTTYCLEGSIFVAGAAIQWLRDGLGIIETSAEVEELAAQVESSDGVYLVPAFVGLGAPYWDANARGMLIGITRGTTKSHIARAAVDSMAYQSAELLEAMRQDTGIELAELRVDGGATQNNALLEFQADLLGVSVVRPKVHETTALGVAWLAGLASGIWSSQDELASLPLVDRVFAPQISSESRQKLMADWKRAVSRCRNWIDDEALTEN